VRDYAAKQELDDVDAARQKGMDEMSETYNKTGRELYKSV
jgi:hypothetical protein